MVFTGDDKQLIKSLRQLKCYSSRRLLKEFPQKNWTRRGLDYVLSNIDKYGTTERVPGSGRLCSARTSDNVATVEELVQSQEDKPQTHRMVRETARETGIHRSSVHRIIRKDLALKCIKKKQVQDLSDANKKASQVRARQLLRCYPDHMVKFMWFSDEKLFSVAAPVNAQNDRLYVPAGTKKRDVNATRLLKTRSNFSKSVMVSIAVPSHGASNIHVLEPRVKINGAYYCDVVLRQMLLPNIRAASGSEFFVFQQHSVPSLSLIHI